MEPETAPRNGDQDPLERFVAEARAGQPGFWRVALVIFAVFIGSFVALFALALLVSQLLTRSEVAAAFDAAQPHPLTAPLFLAVIAATGPVVLGSVQLFHRRPGQSLFGPYRAGAGRLRFDSMARAAWVTLAVGVAVLAIAWTLGLVTLSWRETAYGASAPERLLIAGVVLLLLPLQAGAEELVFRGYLLQEAARRSRSFLAWGAAPSLLFGLAHLGGPPLSSVEQLAVFVGAAMFGLFAALLTARSGDLSLAIGAHVGNNALALVIVETPYGFGGPAPLALAYRADWSLETNLFAMLAVSAASLVAVYRLLGREMDAP